jgi:DNA-binding SARP family transcriptional activator
VEYRILGPLEVLLEGRQIALGSAQPRAVLAVLLLHANEVVSVERLADELWGESPPPTATKTVQLYVSQLRKALGPDADVIETCAPGYVIHAEPEQIDVGRFERLVAEARERAMAGDADAAAGLFRQSLALWRGPVLAGLTFESLARIEVAQLEDRRVAARMDEIDCALALGDAEQVVGELETLVAQHPLLERAREQLMLALYRSGRQAEALAAYQQMRGVLVDELGIEPGRSLRELERAILRQDPSLDRVPTRPEAADMGGGVFVGREAELEELRSGLEAAVAGRGGLVLLVGEPGIGKSRLADEVMRQGRALGALALVGRCWEAGGAPAYWPWVQALRTYVEQSDPQPLRSQLADGAADIAQIIPGLRELFADLPEPPPETEGARFRLFDATARFLRSAAATRPLVLVLDDLHAADEPSLLLLRFVAGELSSTRVLVVGTYRDVDPTVRDPLASTLAELSREQVTRRIALGGLTAPDVARYIELSSGATPAGELAAAIHSETEGNPLFVGEVVRLLAAEGRLSEADAGALWTLGIPQGVREVIGRRLRRLSPGCVDLLTLASVVGREFGVAAMERLSELPAEELLGALDEAVAARLLTSVPASRGRLRFAHALIRETLYEGLTTPRRVQLHRSIGEALETFYGHDAEQHLAELAHHFFEAVPGGDAGKALDYALRAGERAVRLLAYEEAARLYEQALQALELRGPVDAVARCDLLLALGDALSKAGSTPEAKEAFVAAADLARTSTLPERLARAALGYGGRFPWLRAGRDTRLVPLLEEALEALGDEESELRVRLLARLAGALRDQPSLEPRSSLSQQAVDIARRLGDPDTLGYALVSLFTATWGPDVERLVPVAEEVSQLAEETGDSERAFEARLLQHVLWMTVGDTARVAVVAEEHRALADELKQASQQWYTTMLRSHGALFRGDFSEAEQLADEALKLGQRAQSWDAGFSYRLLLFVLRREQGRLEEIDDGIRASLDEYVGYRSLRCLVAVLECELGREKEARRAFDELARADFAALPRDGEWLFCLCLLAEVAAHLHDRDRAAILYDQLLPFANRNALATGDVAVGSVARYLGLLASTTSQWDDAARHFEEALEMNARMGARPWLAHTKHDYARMLLSRDAPGDRERATLLLSEALTTYQELGMPKARASALALDPARLGR